MNNDPDQSLDALFAAARRDVADTLRLEYGFETRLGARLRAEQSSPSMFAWAGRLSPFFGVLALLVVWWGAGWGSTADLVAEAAHVNEDQMLVAYLTGDR